MAPGRIRSIDEAIERLYELKVGVIGTAAGDRHERPHKPALLLAVLDLIADGQAHPGAIPWSRALRRRFDEYFAQVRSHDDQATPQNPFRLLSDHPSNGLALCKNHHWAMDRFLIAPGTDGAWRTSPRLIPHRSPGEQSLAGLRGQAVLAPREVAFMPALAALDWRCSRLLT